MTRMAVELMITMFDDEVDADDDDDDDDFCCKG